MAGVITLLDQPRTLDALGRATDALIYFYYTGTTVLAPIFNNEDLTDPATNPIDLAAGEIFPDIFLDDSITYRRRILYGDGTIHDVDPLPTGAGAGSGVVSVKDFGAVGNGIADDTVAIQEAIDSLNQGGSLYFPKGEYKITDTLDVIFVDLWNGITIWGDGPSSKITWAGGNNKPMLHMRGVAGAGWYSKNIVEKIQFYGNSGPGGTYTGVEGIRLGDTPELITTGICNPTVRNCLIRHTSVGIRIFYETDEVSIYGNYIEHHVDVGIYNQHGGSGVWITNNHISDGGVNSIAIRSSLYSTSINSNIIQGLQYLVGIQIDGGTTMQGAAVSIRDNYLECGNPGNTYGIILYGVDTGVIENNTFHGFAGTTALINLTSISGVHCNNIRIGPNRHTVSGAPPLSFVVGTTSQTDCQITGRQSWAGASNFVGSWQFTTNNGAGNAGVGTGSPQKKWVISDNGAHGFEFSPNDAGGGYNRMLSYDRNASVYRRVDWEAEKHIFRPADGSEKIRVGDTGIGFGTAGDATQLVDINSDSLRLRTAKTPATAAATGTQGQFCWDNGFLYVCVATNTWKRVAIATW